MQPPPDMRPNAKGDFVKTPLAHLLVFMADRRLSGSLVLHGDDGSSTTIYLAGGAPAKVQTSYPGTHLGRVLLQLGFLDEETLKVTSEMVRQGAGLHGQLLLSMGKIDQAQLVAGLREQLMRRMMRLFEKLGDLTTYAFYNAVNLLDRYGGPELTPIDPFRIIWEGVHLRPHDPHIESTLARLGSAPLRLSSGADLRRFGFGPPEGKVIDILKARPMSVEGVLDLQIMPVRQLKLLLYVLLITRSIELPASASARPAASSSPSVAPASPPPAQPAPPARPAAPPAVAAPPRSPAMRAPFPSDPADRQVPSSRSPTARAKPATARTPMPTPAAAINPAAASAPELEDRRATIRARAQSLESEDFFQVLGVAREDSVDVVRSVYFGLAKQWHPDRLPEALSDVREDAARVFAKISEAFQTLSDPERRKHYLEMLGKGGGEDDEQAKVQRVIEATIDFQKADVFMRKRDMAKALKHAKSAYEGDPEQADHAALYAWVLAMQPDRQQRVDFGESLELLKTAIEREPRCERAYFYRALLLKQVGQHNAALRDFRKASELNPRNIDAVRELRLAEMRGSTKDEPTPAGKGAVAKGPAEDINWSKDSVGEIFGKLFKRKP